MRLSSTCSSTRLSCGSKPSKDVSRFDCAKSWRTSGCTPIPRNEVKPRERSVKTSSPAMSGSCPQFLEGCARSTRRVRRDAPTQRESRHVAAAIRPAPSPSPSLPPMKSSVRPAGAEPRWRPGEAWLRREPGDGPPPRVRPGVPERLRRPGVLAGSPGLAPALKRRGTPVASRPAPESRACMRHTRTLPPQRQPRGPCSARRAEGRPLEVFAGLARGSVIKLVGA